MMTSWQWDCALLLWRSGRFDTVDIAERVGVSEAVIWNEFCKFKFSPSRLKNHG